MSISDLIKLCISSWDHYKKYSKENGVARKFIEWLNDDRFGIDQLKKYAENITPYYFQEKTMEKILEYSLEGKILLIKAPTASGKTEIPFIPFLNQLCTKEFRIAPRLIYSLPLRSLSNVMWERASVYLLGTLIRVFDDLGEIEIFLKEKGWFEKNILKLPIGLETGSLIKEGDFLYGGFITVGTIDAIIYSYVTQRIPGGLRNPRLSLPSGLLSTSLFVLDEVQMLQDEYYHSPRILNIILNQLASIHMPIIIMTATMPNELKNRMLLGIDYEEIIELQSRRGMVLIDINFLKRKERMLRILVQKELLKKIENNIELGKHSLIVVNKVSTAIKIYKEISQIFGDKIVLIHGKLNVKDRETAEEKLEKEKGLVVVATQVVESGYDFDAGLIITEVAPPDSLIQRIGRIARKTGELGEAFIVDVEDTEPYHQKIIDATKNLLLEDEGLIGEALQNMEKSQMLLDEIYKKEYVDEFIKSENLKYVHSLHYLHKLRLFSLPPEGIQFTFRPEMYVTLITTNNDQLSKIRQMQNNVLTRNEFEKFRETLEMNSLNVSVNFARSLAEKGLLYGKLDTSPVYGEGLVRVTIAHEDKKKQYIHPLEIWLLEPQAYEDSLGIKEV
ncbi:CRISPR-associated helicase Cas3' [Candidatus Bathyarchaeota archaeon]|nr:CRISPR-associated helicase Cas3' [Candidatus Bathyarchaeota archaeon]MBS7618155.1 CRISPR-associated helicase Cas3' [Candidatus Bathyarchaeota archaeon]